MHFDYTELTKPVPFADRLNYLRERPLYYQVAIGLLLVVDVIFIGIFLVGLPSFFGSDIGLDSQFGRLSAVTLITGGIAIAMPLILLRALGNELREKRFAAANAMSFYSGRMDQARSGLVFQHGDARRFDMLFTPSKGNIYEFGTYCYDTGSGKNRTTHHYGFVHVKLSRSLPNIVLDSRHNNLLGETGLPGTLNRDQMLHLEGDFDNYFTLYAPKQYERDALYIFTPDVMQAMVDASRHYDGEIVDDDFYLYTSKLNLHDTQSIEELMSIADRIGGQLNKQASNYADKRTGAAMGQGAIATPGVRLKATAIPRVLIVVAAVIVTYWIIALLYR